MHTELVQLIETLCIVAYTRLVYAFNTPLDGPAVTRTILTPISAEAANLPSLLYDDKSLVISQITLQPLIASTACAKFLDLQMDPDGNQRLL